jgi:hypothetical protein
VVRGSWSCRAGLGTSRPLGLVSSSRANQAPSGVMGLGKMGGTHDSFGELG